MANPRNLNTGIVTICHELLLLSGLICFQCISPGTCERKVFASTESATLPHKQHNGTSNEITAMMLDMLQRHCSPLLANMPNFFLGMCTSQHRPQCKVHTSLPLCDLSLMMESLRLMGL